VRRLLVNSLENGSIPFHGNEMKPRVSLTSELITRAAFTGMAHGSTFIQRLQDLWTKEENSTADAVMHSKNHPEKAFLVDTCVQKGSHLNRMLIILCFIFWGWPFLSSDDASSGFTSGEGVSGPIEQPTIGTTHDSLRTGF